MNIKVMLLGSAAAAYFAFRFYQNARMKSGTKSLVAQLKKDPETGESFAESLDISVLKKELAVIDLETNLSPFIAQTTNKLGGFLIQHIQKLADGSYLFVTNVKSSDIVTNGRRQVESEEVHNLNFVLKPANDKGQFAVYSDLHTELTDKNLRTEFANALFKLIQA